MTACQVTAGLPGASSSLDAAPCVLTARMRHLQVLYCIDAVASISPRAEAGHTAGVVNHGLKGTN
jgi:hypothetical protein